VFSSVGFCLWDAQDDGTNFRRNFTTGQVEMADGVIYQKTNTASGATTSPIFGCSGALDSFDSQREAFWGRYGSWERPAAVEKGRAL
jgi:cellobiose phosphorylase